MIEVLLLKCPTCITDLMFVNFCVNVKRTGRQALLNPPLLGPFLRVASVVFLYIKQHCVWKLYSVLQEAHCCSVPTTGLKKGSVKAVPRFSPDRLSLLVCCKASRAGRYFALPSMCANGQIVDLVSLSKILNANCDLLILLSASRSVHLWELFSL